MKIELEVKDKDQAQLIRLFIKSIDLMSEQGGEDTTLFIISSDGQIISDSMNPTPVRIFRAIYSLLYMIPECEQHCDCPSCKISLRVSEKLREIIKTEPGRLPEDTIN